MLSDATLLTLAIVTTLVCTLVLIGFVLDWRRTRRACAASQARVIAMADEAHNSAAAERARRYTAQIPANPHHRAGHDASLRSWDGATTAAFGFTRPADEILAGYQAPSDSERLTAAHAAAQAAADGSAPPPPHPDSDAAARAALDPATLAHMQRGDHLVWQPPVYTPLPARGAADEITPALERRLRHMMRDEIARARAREMGGG